jgi:AcrR family transcriptional regulator
MVVHTGCMDARAQRTRQALARTVLALAEQGPLSQISVTDLSRAAGITRPTFYAHADSPGDLLAAVLGRQLETLTETAAAAAEPNAAWDDAPGRALVEHVRDNAAIYRQNLDGRLPHELRNVLIDHTERTVIAHFLRHPETLPLPLSEFGRGPVDVAEAQYRLAALFAEVAASGTVAALEAWLCGPDPLDTDWVIRAIRLGSAQWVQQPS